jgi:hypothetical protein
MESLNKPLTANVDINEISMNLIPIKIGFSV